MSNTGQPDPIELEAPTEIRRLQNRLLQAQVQYLAEHSRFYQEKFTANGVGVSGVRSIDDLVSLPFTTKDEIRTSLERVRPLGEHLAAPTEDLVQFQSSSGTTGRPSHVGVTKADLQDWIELIRRSLVAVGFRPGDRVLHALGMSRGWVGGLPVIEGLQALGAGVIPIGAEPGTTWLLNVIRDLEPIGLLATPNFAVYLGEQSESVLRLPASELSIRKIFTGGEPGAGIASFRMRAESLWDAEMREVMGGTDISPVLWAECEDRSGMHFIGPDSVYFELISVENQSPVAVAEGAVGELVYTHLKRRACPVLRFRHGDIVRVTGIGCSCGRTGAKIRCFGRADDMFIVKGVNVYPSAILDIVLGLRPMTTGAMRILKESPDYAISGPLRIRVERSSDLTPEQSSALAKHVEQLISDLCRCRTIIELVPPGTYPLPGRDKVVLVEKAYS